MGNIASLLLAGDRNTASSLAAAHHYQVKRHIDLATGRWIIVLSERQKDGSTYPWRQRTSTNKGATWHNAWGLYVFAPSASTQRVVQVPHPLFDEHTELMGVAAFRQGDARCLFIAGAHRYANPADGTPVTDEEKKEQSPADVAHYLGGPTVFGAIHEIAIAHVNLPDPKVVQYHGYGADETKYPGAQYSQLVVSDGVAKSKSGLPAPTALAKNVHAALVAAGFGNACLYDGVQGGKLGATKNLQGKSLRDKAMHNNFVHIETSSTLRTSPGDAKMLHVARSAVSSL